MKQTITLLILLIAISSLAIGQQKTDIQDRRAASMLFGPHKISLQWISWNYFGKASVTNHKGLYHLAGEQKGRGNSDFVSLDGNITNIEAKEFTFDGKIITQVSHINGGQPCVRSGKFTFRITGKRRYWRMQQIDNPCDEAADYVDIYFR
jgi:hypothetical protein